MLYGTVSPPRLMSQMDTIFSPYKAKWQYCYVGMLLPCFVFKLVGRFYGECNERHLNPKNAD